VINRACSAAETLRSALALGADAGIQILLTDMRIDQDLLPQAVAKVF
jgi:electron transfer flavoprotein alpha/beta subunit